METTSAKIIRVYDTEKGNRASLDSYMQELMYYSLPRKAYITKLKNMGDRLPTDIYDSTAILSNAYFAAGMQAYMSSAQTRWFALGIDDKQLMKSRKVMDFLRDTEEVLYSIINGSNFYQEDVDGYLDLGAIGTNILYGESDDKEHIRFHSMPIENVIVMNDSTGRVTSAYIEYEFDCSQAIDKFKRENVGEEVLKCFERANYSKKFKYVFAIYPRGYYDQSKKDSKNMPYAAIWVDRERKMIVRETGFKEFPFFVTRFASSKNSPYGVSPCMNVLSDVKMLNEMEYNNIISAQLANRPPLEIPDEAFLKPYNFNPGGKNIKNAGYPNEHISAVNTGANVRIGMDYIEYKKKGINQAFYNDLFLSMEQIGNRTATEVQIMNNQRMQLLGSAIGNIMREKLSPVIDRVFGIAGKAGMLPDLPEELREKNYVVNYISPLARAQKALELNNISQAMQIIGQFAQMQLAAGRDASVMDMLDFDEAVNYVADVTDVNPRVILDEQEVSDLRAARQEEQQAMAQIQMLQQGADAAKTGGEADKVIAEAGNVQ